MDRWDLLIIGAAGYVSVVALVRLMGARRDELVQRVRQQIEEQKAQQGAGASAEADADRPAA